MHAHATRLVLISRGESRHGEILLGGLRDRGWNPELVVGEELNGELLDAGVVHFLGADHARRHVGALGPGSRVAVTFSARDASVAGLEAPDHYGAVWSRADVLHFPDEAVLARTLGRGCPPDLPRRVVPALVDAPAIDRPREGRGGPLRVLCAGPLEWTAGYEHGLQGLAHARESGVECECRMVGAGSHLSALLFARHQLGLGDRVTFSDDGLADHLAWADVFLAPTVIDGLPDHVAEAGAARLALVLADPGPLGELGPGEAALIIPRRDPEAVADALRRLAADPERREAMGTAAHEWSRAQFRTDDQLDGLDELYRSVA